MVFLLPGRDLVDEAKDFHLMPERRPHLPAFKTRQRCCTSITGLVYAVGGLNSSGLLALVLVLVPVLVPVLTMLAWLAYSLCFMPPVVGRWRFQRSRDQT